MANSAQARKRARQAEETQQAQRQPPVVAAHRGQEGPQGDRRRRQGRRDAAAQGVAGGDRPHRGQEDRAQEPRVAHQVAARARDQGPGLTRIARSVKGRLRAPFFIVWLRRVGHARIRLLRHPPRDRHCPDAVGWHDYDIGIAWHGANCADPMADRRRAMRRCRAVSARTARGRSRIRGVALSRVARTFGFRRRRSRWRAGTASLAQDCAARRSRPSSTGSRRRAETELAALVARAAEAPATERRYVSALYGQALVAAGRNAEALALADRLERDAVNPPDDLLRAAARLVRAHRRMAGRRRRQGERLREGGAHAVEGSGRPVSRPIWRR